MKSKKILKYCSILFLLIVSTYLIYYQQWQYSIGFIKEKQTISMLIDYKTRFLSYPSVTDIMYEQKPYVSTLSEINKTDYYLAFLFIFQYELSNNGEGSLVYWESIEGYEVKMADRIIELRNGSYYSYINWKLIGIDKIENTLRYTAKNNKLRYQTD